MTASLSNPLVRVAFSRPGEATLSAEPAEVEGEVVILFDEFRDRLLRYALTFGLSVHDGEEIIQEVFLSLFRHLRLGRSRENLRGWLFRVAHNLALKHRMATCKVRQSIHADGSLVDQHLDPAPNPEEQLASSQRQARLRAVFRALPEREQRCLHLRSEGLRYREIANVLGMSLGAVSMSLTRSLARLERADER